MMTTEEIDATMEQLRKTNAKIGRRHVLPSATDTEYLPPGLREHHEAGHAVVCRVLGGTVRSIDSRPANPQTDLNVPTILTKAARAAVAAAGSVAESMYGLSDGRMRQDYPRDGANQDVKLAFDELHAKPIGFATDEWHAGCDLAADLLREHRRFFLDTVAALVQHGQLSDEDFDAIAKRHGW